MTEPSPPAVQELLALNNDPDYVSHINCYGFAMGVTLAEVAQANLAFGAKPGDFSKNFRNNAIVAALPVYLRTPYQLLADGLLPIPPDDAETAPGHVITGADCGESYHFFRRVKPQLWIAKEGSTPIDEPIRDINKALIRCLWNSQRFMLGFFQVPEDRLQLGAQQPKPYATVAANAMGDMLSELWMNEPHLRRIITQEIKMLGLDKQLADYGLALKFYINRVERPSRSEARKLQRVDM